MRHSRISHVLGLAALLLGPAGVSFAALDADGYWHLKAGAGFSPVVGGLNSTITDGWNFAVGLEREISDEASVTLEYMNSQMGLGDRVLNDYTRLLGGTAVEGDSDLWSLTVNPKWKFKLGQRTGGYLIGGGGYYHIGSEVTTPGVAYQPPYCDYYWGCWPGGFVEADRIVAERKDDTGGVNFGAGFTFELLSGTQFFIESRYHHVLIHGPDLQLLPLTAGFRF